MKRQIQFSNLKTPVFLQGFTGSSFARLITKVQKHNLNFICVITQDNKSADHLKDEIRFFNPTLKVSALTQFDVLPYYGLSPNPRIVKKTLSILNNLLNKDLDILIVPLSAFLKRYIPLEAFLELSLDLCEEQTYSQDKLIKKLISFGYERTPLVENVGEFGVRGDIVDIFSPHTKEPVRISFFDNEVEWIKFFDSVSQKTKDNLYKLTILPLQEISVENILQAQANIENNKASAFDLIFNEKCKRHLKRKADKKSLEKPKRDKIAEAITNGIQFHGIEFFISLFYKNTATLFDYLPKDSAFVFSLEKPSLNLITLLVSLFNTGKFEIFLFIISSMFFLLKTFASIFFFDE